MSSGQQQKLFGTFFPALYMAAKHLPREALIRCWPSCCRNPRDAHPWTRQSPWDILDIWGLGHHQLQHGTWPIWFDDLMIYLWIVAIFYSSVKSEEATKVVSPMVSLETMVGWCRFAFGKSCSLTLCKFKTTPTRISGSFLMLTKAFWGHIAYHFFHYHLISSSSSIFVEPPRVSGSTLNIASLFGPEDLKCWTHVIRFQPGKTLREATVEV